MIGLPDNPETLAVTVFGPAVAPSVKTVAACPKLLVGTEPADNVPPPAVTEKVTVVPATGFPLASVTFTTKGLLSARLVGPV